ncbi:MAG: peptidoglycan DD-metalloendopeptidase family protein [Xanthomonadales bacterium]|nr:peptidoglycan DD-metalloendopeptidase family protein [Xanthomonadales bacterium]
MALRPVSAVCAAGVLCAFLLAAVTVPRTVLAQAIPDDPVARSRQAQVTQAQLETLRRDLAALKTELAERARAEPEAARALARAERAVSAHQGELEAIVERSRAQRTALEAIAARQREVEQTLAQQRQALAALLRLDYARSRQAPARQLLDPGSAPRLVRALGYGQVLQRGRLRQIAAHAERLVEWGRLAQAEGEALAALAAEEEAARDALHALQAAAAEREAALRALRDGLAEGQRRLAALDRDEQAMVRLLEQLRDIFADLPRTFEGQQPFRERRGRLPWPVSGRAEAGEHGGVMIPAQAGTPVRAVAHGRVAFADWLKGYGLLLILDHGEGWMSLYGQNEALLQPEGAWVQAGDAIARVGRSGGSLRDGLHFELRERGRPVDARAWLQRR